jgi:hypothetical protein
VLYSFIFVFAFIAKMMLSTLPYIIDGKKLLTKAVVMQLEENSKEESKDNKELDNQFKKGTDFLKSFDSQYLKQHILKTADLSFFSKKYINSFHSKVLTPPPNFVHSIA